MLTFHKFPRGYWDLYQTPVVSTDLDLIQKYTCGGNMIFYYACMLLSFA